MPKYKDTYTRDGIDFHVTEKHEIICLLVGTYRHSPTLHTYEVHLLRMVKQGGLSPDAGKMILSAPSTEDWGKYGWTYLSLEAAQEKFDELVKQTAIIAV
jgi:hypothetical protein